MQVWYNAKPYTFTFILIVTCSAFVFSMPWLLTRKFGTFSFNVTTGAIGDTMGGLTAPFISLLSGLLVYYSFREQVKANKMLMESSQSDIFFENMEKFWTRVEMQIHNYQNQFGKSFAEIAGNNAYNINTYSISDSWYAPNGYSLVSPDELDAVFAVIRKLDHLALLISEEYTIKQSLPFELYLTNTLDSISDCFGDGVANLSAAIEDKNAEILNQRYSDFPTTYKRMMETLQKTHLKAVSQNYYNRKQRMEAN